MERVTGKILIVQAAHGKIVGCIWRALSFQPCKRRMSDKAKGVDYKKVKQREKNHINLNQKCNTLKDNEGGVSYV